MTKRPPERRKKSTPHPKATRAKPPKRVVKAPPRRKRPARAAARAAARPPKAQTISQPTLGRTPLATAHLEFGASADAAPPNLQGPPPMTGGTADFLLASPLSEPVVVQHPALDEPSPSPHSSMEVPDDPPALRSWAGHTISQWPISEFARADAVAPGGFEDGGTLAITSGDALDFAPLPVTGAPRVVEPAEDDADATSPLLFEVAWEVCCQLGGIYTVLRTKAPAMLEQWQNRYCLIGPYNPQTAPVEFEALAPPAMLGQVIQRMRDAGMTCHYGQWLIPGRPRVVLIDPRDRHASLNIDKYLLWKDHAIATPSDDAELDGTVAFGFAVTEFFRHLKDVCPRPVVAHFHEWMGAVAVMRLAHRKIPIATVFTTHATLLGRYLANDDRGFYQHLDSIDADAEAARRNILARHRIERAAALNATVFTTVSQVTADEAAGLLGRRPEVLLPNGLTVRHFTALHEFQNLHRQYKERIHRFVMGHFFPNQTFDLDRTLYFFISGRYEYRNKGMDLFIESLWRLNERLRGVADRPTIVAFIVTRAAVRHMNVKVLESQVLFNDLKNTCRGIQEEMGAHLMAAAVHGRLPGGAELFEDDADVRLKRAIHAWRTGRPPAVVTHDLADEASDPILSHLRHRRLLNGPNDAVKVVFHPQFLSATSPLLGLDYEAFVRGCHLGVFPSAYEPWGYTPMEGVALGIPSVTTDLSGFGAYVRTHVPDSQDHGIWVLDRKTPTFEQSVEDLVEIMLGFTRLSRRQRIDLRARVERLGALFDWSVMVRHYIDAHRLALQRLAPSPAPALESAAE